MSSNSWMTLIAPLLLGKCLLHTQIKQKYIFTEFFFNGKMIIKFAYLHHIAMFVQLKKSYRCYMSNWNTKPFKDKLRMRWNARARFSRWYLYIIQLIMSRKTFSS